MSESTRVDRRRRFLLQTLARVLIVAALWAVTTGLLHLATEPLPPCTETSTSVCSGPPTDHSTNGDEYDSLPPCPTEDSDGCHWDASEQGNGQGHDVVTQP